MGRFFSNPSLDADKLPMVRRFVFDPYKNPKIVKDYYESYDEQTALANEYKLTKKKPADYDAALHGRLKSAHCLVRTNICAIGAFFIGVIVMKLHWAVGNGGQTLAPLLAYADAVDICANRSLADVRTGGSIDANSTWRAVISPCVKYSNNTGSDSSALATPTQDDIWIMGAFEVFASVGGVIASEKNFQARYEYFLQGNSVIHNRHYDPSTSGFWWLRSFRTSATYYGVFVHSDNDGGEFVFDLSNELANTNAALDDVIISLLEG